MYCVVKNTSIVVDSNAEENVMLQNAKNTGLTDEEVEIITKEEYLARVDLEYIEKPTELEILKQEKEILAQSVYEMAEIIELILMGGIE